MYSIFNFGTNSLEGKFRLVSIFISSTGKYLRSICFCRRSFDSRMTETEDAVPSVSSNVRDRRLVKSLLEHSEAIASMEPLRILLKKSSESVIRKAALFSVLFEEIVRDPPVNRFSPCTVLCFQELCVVLPRIREIIEECGVGSRMWLLMQIPSILSSFRQSIGELAMLLDIFPSDELDLNEDLEELVNLIRNQCSKKPWDPDDLDLRNEVLKMLENIKREIVPDHAKLSEILTRLKLTDSTSCSNEIENLEKEVQNQEDESKAEEAIALIGLMRYAKCVTYGASTPPIVPLRLRSASEINIPADFRCPVSLDLMTDPVAVSTGQTYDRSSITMWIESGHATCPKTGQPLAHTQLIPNLALKNLIAMWCRDQGIPLDFTEGNGKNNGVHTNKASLEATKMTASFLVGKLTAAQSPETMDQLVYELRVLAKTDSDTRACIAEAGALPLLVKFLGSEQPTLQINAITAILNLSILEANKTSIMETDGVINGVIEVLKSGATWEAKGNAAATIFSLSWIQAYRKKLGRKTRVITALVDLAKMGPTNARRDALMAILNLAGNREAAAKLVEAGVVDLVGDVMDPLVEEAVAVLEAVVKRGGLRAILAVHECKMVEKLIKVMRNGCDRVKEGAAATLVNICRKGGLEMAAEMASVTGIERAIGEILGTGTERGKRKAALLLRILRRLAAEMVTDNLNVAVDESRTHHVTASTRIVSPA